MQKKLIFMHFLDKKEFFMNKRNKIFPLKKKGMY